MEINFEKTNCGYKAQKLQNFILSRFLSCDL